MQRYCFSPVPAIPQTGETGYLKIGNSAGRTWSVCTQTAGKIVSLSRGLLLTKLFSVWSSFC